MSRRGRCMACDGVKGKRIYHTCGLEDRIPEKQEIKELEFSVLDPVNWFNGKLHPNRVPIMRMIKELKSQGLSLQEAEDKIVIAWALANKETAKIDDSYIPNWMWESQDAAERYFEHFRKIYNEK